MLASRILLVDDEAGPRFGVRRFLKANGFDVEESDDCESAREKYKTFRPDVSIVDYRLPDGNAVDLLQFFRSIDNAPVIVLTAYGSIDIAVEAIKAGAEHFLTKPVELGALLLLIQRLLTNQRTKNQLTARQKSGQQRNGIDPFLGSSKAILDLKEGVDAALRADSAVLLRGETGTGKTVLARWIHEQSRRADGAFVDLNCAGLSRGFLETELFGHEKGAFTGASGAKEGLLEVAHHGTVFLDEIGDMDAQVQAAILKVLEEKRFRRLGDVKDRLIDVRLIAATHHPLVKRVEEGRFRQDLYFRISTFEIAVPSLRDRRADIPVLAQHMISELAREFGVPKPTITPGAEATLVSYHWPGNLRELRNVLERALLHSTAGTIEPSKLFFRAEESPAAAPPGVIAFAGTLDELERDYILQVLADESGQVEKAAERLGISRSAVYYKLRKHGVENPRIKN